MREAVSLLLDGNALQRPRQTGNDAERLQPV